MAQLRRRDFIAAAATASLLHAEGTGRIVAVGDVHGDLDRFIDVLTMAGLVDDKQHWSGGKTQLVQLGDTTDRGLKSAMVIDFLMQLDREARQAKGRVWCLIGNHEAMRMQGDLRYVPAAEYDSFRTKKSEQEREKWFQRELAVIEANGDPQRADLALGFRQNWEKEHPLGQAELIRAFSPVGQYGKWVLQQRAVLKLGDSLFIHGGISAKYAEWSESRFNDRVREDIILPMSQTPEENVTQDPQGPLWYRGLAQDPEESLAPLVDQLLARHKVKRIIIGHTPTKTGVVSRLQGKVILADVGLSQYFGARRACVVLEHDAAFSLDRGKLTQLK
jgi:hypothetical protein